MANKSFSAAKIRAIAPKTEMRSICGVQITFFEKARKTKKTSDFRWFSESNLLKPFVMEAPRRSGLRTSRYRLRSISPAPSLLLSPQSLPTLWGPLDEIPWNLTSNANRSPISRGPVCVVAYVPFRCNSKPRRLFFAFHKAFFIVFDRFIASF